MPKLIGFIIQARTGSQRLPFKIIKDFSNGKSILQIILSKLKREFAEYPIILATSSNLNDEHLNTYAKEFAIDFFQGDEKNVLKRFIEAASEANLTHIVRVCADNPFISAASIKKLLEEFNRNDLDYISYKNSVGVPTIKTHLGLFTEIVSLDALKFAAKETQDPVYQEHVTNYIYEHPTSFKIKLVPAPDIVFSRNDIRLTIDDIQDFEHLSILYRNTCRFADDIPSLIRYIDQQPYLKNVMTNNISKYTK